MLNVLMREFDMTKQDEVKVLKKQLKNLQSALKKKLNKQLKTFRDALRVNDKRFDQTFKDVAGRKALITRYEARALVIQYLEYLRKELGV